MKWLKAFRQKQDVPPGAGGEIPAPSSPPAMPVAAEKKAGSGEPGKPIPPFTPRAQQVLALARKEAERLRHNFVGTEHVLLGLLALGKGVAVNVLQKMGLDPATGRAEVEKEIGIGSLLIEFGNIPYTPRVKKVLALAAKEAIAMQHTYIGTEHILLGLLREGGGGAGRVLKKYGGDLEKARQEILRELDPNYSPAESTEPAARSDAGEPPLDRSELRRDLFTPRVRRAFTLAREDAGQRNQRLIGTQHVLLGLVRMGQGVAADVLLRIGVNAETVGARMEDPAAPDAVGKAAESPPFAPLVKEMLSFAAEEARALEHTYIGTEHVLLGLLRQPHGGAARIFKELYIDPDSLRQQIVIAFEVKTHDPARHPAKAKTEGLPGLQDTEMFAKKSPLPPAAQPIREPLDTTLRYDVYCVEPNGKNVAYRNVQFKAYKGLMPRNDYDQSSDFVELEQSDGQKVFVAKSTIVRFCPTGSEIGNQ